MELRPLSIGELLDRTFSYYRRNFWLFVGIVAAPQVAMVAVSLFSIRPVNSSSAIEVLA
ncbi:MAG TPA: hypothetical protein VG028_13675 [Terriglobia bacterium]|nr:hypothetical protein [Terriglobia bacterium]